MSTREPDGIPLSRPSRLPTLPWYASIVSQERERPALRLVSPQPVGSSEDPPDLTPEQAYRRYARYVGGIAFRLLGNDDEVDDVVQEVFVEFIRAGEAPSRSLKGWLGTVTTRAVAKRLKKRTRRRVFGIGLGTTNYEEVAGVGTDPEDATLLARVYRELDRIPVPERVAWTLRHVEGLELTECADRCDCSLATVKRRIRSAHTRLNRRLGLGTANE